MRGNGTRDRGWGPFTGRQLTTIICIGLVTVLFPIGAWAVTGSTTFITDATSGKQATVNSAGALTITGTVNPIATATASMKASPVLNTSGLGGWLQLMAGSSTTRMLITEIHVDVWAEAAPGSGDAIQFAVGNCGSLTNPPLKDAVNPSGLGVTQLEYQPIPLVVPAGSNLCMKDTDPANLDADVFAFGYPHV